MSTGLLTRIAAGDCGAVDECLSRYGGLVWSLVRRHLPNPAEAEEAVQEIFIDLWRHAGRFNERVASEATFIAMIARRRIIDFRRKRQRTISTITYPPDLDRAASDESDQIALGEEINWAREQLALLRPVERTVIEMAIDKGMSHSQIAEELDLALGTVKSNARRGLIRLRQLFLQRPSQPIAGRAQS